MNTVVGVRSSHPSDLPLAPTIRGAAATADYRALLLRLRAMSVRGLARMFNPAEEMFAFRIRRTAYGVAQEGLSPRYTAISLLGMAHLAGDDVARILKGSTPEEVFSRLIERVVQQASLGDVALTLWAAAESGVSSLEPLVARLKALEPAEREHTVVELSWALSALSHAALPELGTLRDRIAERLLSTYNTTSKFFPHAAGVARVRHVACFADLIYPIQALSKYAQATGHQRALDVASESAQHLCSLQGAGGQWWWHYDYRTGRVIERYPVYAIHQDAMGPMALLALRDAGGPDCMREVRRGLDWLVAAPELNGGSLIDAGADLIWRKVARRESRKTVRYLQAMLSRVNKSLRVPAVDRLFPPRAIDYEDRPYHLGWLLYAWRDGNLSTGPRMGADQ
jgi:hypothetical protein